MPIICLSQLNINHIILKIVQRHPLVILSEAKNLTPLRPVLLTKHGGLALN